ncbi:MAG: hypothetical protein ACRDTC_15770 [Pseudonocardiaceae bacterium]
MADHEPMTDVACGEPELSGELRDALALLRDRSDNDEFRTLVDEVLAGRTSLLDASGTKAFGEMVFARMAEEIQSHREVQSLCPEPGAQPAACGPCTGCTSICALSGTHPSG